MADLKDVATHFAFGKNWESYAALVDAGHVEEAKKGLSRLIPADEFPGRSFLDIGCGSGLHALAAAALGVTRIMAVDIDPDSVATARGLLDSRKVSVPWSAETLSVFALDPARHGTYDIVYSWGVLHHTGAMWEAIEKAAAMVAPGGCLAIALYRRTRLDPFWVSEKRIYAHAPRALQAVIRACYVAAFRLAMLVTRRSFGSYVANYKSARGMDYYHDVHDWLGGHPYESALAPEVEVKLTALGFKAERVFARPLELGIFGSGCDEYVYRLNR